MPRRHNRAAPPRGHDTALAVKKIVDAPAHLARANHVPCPSEHDRARNPHRSGIAWSKSAVRVILTNPSYTGRQVWNKQRTDESSSTSTTSHWAIPASCGGTPETSG